jgi:C-terminal processing protease CtpA/Prc
VLQALKRVTVVGEQTVGGSGTIEFKPIDDHFTLVVPTGRVSSPATKSDFAAGGVVPDVKVAAVDALETAVKLAVEATRR